MSSSTSASPQSAPSSPVRWRASSELNGRFSVGGWRCSSIPCGRFGNIPRFVRFEKTERVRPVGGANLSSLDPDSDRDQDQKNRERLLQLRPRQALSDPRPYPRPEE